MAGPSNYIIPLPTFDKPVKVLIVASPYYKDISDHQVAGAKAEIAKAGATWDIVEVPGALEIPTAIGIAERMSNFDGYVALGCVIRGETTHYDTVCNDSSRAIQLLGLQGMGAYEGKMPVEQALTPSVSLHNRAATNPVKPKRAAACDAKGPSLETPWSLASTPCRSNGDAVRPAFRGSRAL